MHIEDEIFKKAKVDYQKLLNYGFKKNNNNYFLEKSFLDNQFKAEITINNMGVVSGKVIDMKMNEEYLALRTKSTGEFAGKVRDSYKKILIYIKNKCFNSCNFIFEQSNRVNEYIKTKYGNDPEFLWSKFPGFAVYRNINNNKWYAIIMNINLNKISNDSGEVEIINVKLGSDKVQKLLDKKGFYEAYHMSKKEWILIVLNDTLKDQEIFKLVDESYQLID